VASSVVERLVYTEDVGGSKPSPPTESSSSEMRSAMGKFLLVSALSIGAILGLGILPEGIWADVNGLPAHPLVIHAVIVLLPLMSLILIFGIFKKRFIPKFHLYLVPATAATTIFAVIAKSSGEELSKVTFLPKEHAEWGERLAAVSVALLVTLILHVLVTVYKRKKVLAKITSFALLAIAITSIALTYVVGHSGAESVWKYKYSTAVERANQSDNG
jgi:uncharacterized membrane protein